MKKRSCLTFFLSVVLIVAFFTGSAVMAAGQPPKQIVIGMTLAVTGPLSSEWGPNALKYQKALESVINGRGGVFVKEYNKRIPIKFIIYDDGSSPEKSVELYEKLATVDKVDFFLAPPASPLLIKASTVAEKYGIPMMGQEGNSPYIYARGLKWLVGVDSPAQNWALSYFNMLKYLMDKNQIPRLTKIAIIVQDNPNTLDEAKGVKQYADVAGIKVVMEEKVPMTGMTDFSTIITKLKAQQPDIVYGAIFNNLAAIFLKQAKSAGLKPFNMHMSRTTLSEPWYNMVGPEIAENVSGMSTTAPYNNKKADLKSWNASLKKAGFSLYEYGCASTRFIAAEALLKGIEAAGTLDRAKVMDALNNLNYQTLYGELVFTKNAKMGPLTVNGMGNKPPYMAQWQKGKIKILWPADVADGKLLMNK